MNRYEIFKQSLDALAACIFQGRDFCWYGSPSYQEHSIKLVQLRMWRPWL